jgi:bzd-type benzoyl-CoA reductase N subunit
MVEPQSAHVKTRTSDPLNTLIDAGRAPLADWPHRYPGCQAVGYMCGYVPEEIIHAGGFSPVRIRGNSEPLRHVDAYMQSFTCALCRSSFDQALAGTLKFLKGTVFAHTCDTMQALVDLWRMNTHASYYVDTVMQPTNLGSRSARPYLISELSRFRKRLGEFAGRSITDDDLEGSVALYDETRRLVKRLHQVRDRLSASDFYAILDAGQVMPCGAYNSLLEALVVGLDAASSDSDGARLFLVGALLDQPGLLDLVQQLGAQVVGDDLCSGMRHYHDQVGAGPPILMLADYYLRRPPCPTKYHPQRNPGHSLLDQVQEVDAEGVVFVLEKFCEPHAFDYALVRRALDKAGVPHLILEIEQTPSLEAQRTRLQAFIEIL